MNGYNHQVKSSRRSMICLKKTTENPLEMSQNRWRISTGRAKLTSGYEFKWQVSITTTRQNMRIMSIRIAAHSILPTAQGRVVHACWLSCMERLWLNFWSLFLHSFHHDSLHLSLSHSLYQFIMIIHLTLYLPCHILLTSKQEATAHRACVLMIPWAYAITPFLFAPQIRF
jgi:hypothetical protein